VDDVVDELVIIERRCRTAADLLQQEVEDVLKAVITAANDVGRSWSGSRLGYQARVYYDGFELPPPDAVFSMDWGFNDLGETKGDWREYRFEEVIDAILARAGNPDLEKVNKSSMDARRVFSDCKQELVATVDALLANAKDTALGELRASVAKLSAFISEQDFLASRRPGGPLMSSDMRALGGGPQTPPHIAIECRAESLFSPRQRLNELESLARQSRLYLQKKMKLKGASVARTEGTVFIGHGRSKAWKDLKEFLQDRLHLRPDEFNLQSAAGMATTERLQQMLDSAVFAFLVMTAEDEHADETMHARENVIHEAGLFQGCLGFRRAIVLLEEGCAEFSNIKGLGQIRFPTGNIGVISEEIRKVLEREGLLPGAAH